MRPQPQSSIDPHWLGLPKARIRRWIQIAESSMAEVEGEAELNTTLCGPCAEASRRSCDAVRSSASSQLMRSHPGSGSPFGRVRLRG
jgi:hypothetical protein